MDGRMTRNRGIKQDRRAMIMIRDQYRCRYCGRQLDPNAKRGDPDFLTIDHVIPLSQGGGNLFSNTVVACEPCNTKKWDRTPVGAGMTLLPVPEAPQWKLADVARGDLSRLLEEMG